MIDGKGGISRRGLLASGTTAAVMAAGSGLSRAAGVTTDIDAAVKAALSAAKATSGGKNADYIPYLAKVPSDLCGISVVDKDGAVFAAGNTDYGFALESISKVVTLKKSARKGFAKGSARTPPACPSTR